MLVGHRAVGLLCMWLSAIVSLVCCRLWLRHHAGEVLPKFIIGTIMFLCCRRGHCKDRSPPFSTRHFALHQGEASYTSLSVAEPPNLMPPRSTCLPLDTKYSRNDAKLRSSVEHTPRENPKIHIFSSGSQMRE